MAAVPGGVVVVVVVVGSTALGSDVTRANALSVAPASTRRFGPAEPAASGSTLSSKHRATKALRLSDEVESAPRAPRPKGLGLRCVRWSSMAVRHRVVVIGAGFGGLRVVCALRDAPVDVTTVDAHDFHTFQPLLYQVATAGLDTDDIAYPIHGIFRRQHNVSVRMASVTGFELDARRVITDRGDPLVYDTPVVAAGSVTDDFGTPGVAEFGFPLKSVADAVALRNHLLTQFEDVALTGEIGGGALDVVVCGGGPTGVEMAGGLVELYQRVLAKTSRTSTSQRRGSPWSKRPTRCSAASTTNSANAPTERSSNAASTRSPRHLSRVSNATPCTSPTAARSRPAPSCVRQECGPIRWRRCSASNSDAAGGSSPPPTSAQPSQCVRQLDLELPDLRSRLTPTGDSR